jgi:hypothetical protein
MILCRNGEMTLDLDNAVFSQSIDFNDIMKDGLARQQEKYTSVGMALDEIMETSKKLVLLFDEAQHLLAHQGFVFRCIRWWLRKNRRNQQIVAVFTGTSAKLVNFCAQPHKSSTGFRRQCVP